MEGNVMKLRTIRTFFSLLQVSVIVFGISSWANELDPLLSGENDFCDIFQNPTINRHTKDFDLDEGIHFLTTHPAFHMDKKQAQEVLLKARNLGDKYLRGKAYKNKYRHGNKFSYQYRDGLVPKVVRVKFDMDGTITFRIPGTDKNKNGASNFFERVVRAGEWIPLGRLTPRSGLLNEKCEVKQTPSQDAERTRGLIHIVDRNEDAIYMELYDGTIKDYRISPSESLTLFDDLTQGLVNLHRLKIVHNDIHDGNIVVKKEGHKEYRAAFIDFENSVSLREHPSGYVFTQEAAAPNHEPPEIHRKFKFHIPGDPEMIETILKRDVFTLGLVMHRILVGKVYPASLKCSSFRGSRSTSLQDCFKNYYHNDLLAKSNDSKIKPFNLNEVFFERVFEPEPEFRMNAQELQSAWHLYKMIGWGRQATKREKYKDVLPSSDFAELKELGYIPNYLVPKVIEQMNQKKNGCFALVNSDTNAPDFPLESLLAVKKHKSLHLIYKDSFEKIKRVDLGDEIYDIKSIKNKIDLLKGLRILTEKAI
jgi:serine/threonine protein kinase